VAERLENDCEVIRVGNRSGDYSVDLSSKDSIRNLYDSVGSFDVLISAAGVSNFAKIDEASDDDFNISIENKLMGQVNLVRIGLPYVEDNGCFTLNSWLFAREPWPGTVPTALVNAGLEGFARAAALDLKQGVRVNIVSPVFVTETAQKMGMDVAGTISAAKTAIAYQKSLEGDENGQVLDVRDYLQ
jgi:NAD(P)-dependent dehydrogenase (short-subunit alcohol dehydrogenase family)